MEVSGKKSSSGLKGNSVIDAIVDHVEKNKNCEFVRIIEKFFKMDIEDKKKFMDYAEKL